MIRVTVELVSAIDPSRDRLLGVAHIVNAGPSAAGTLYECRLSKWAPREKQTWKSRMLLIGNEHREMVEASDYGQIPDFDNKARGAWDLLYLALKAVVGKRNL